MTQESFPLDVEVFAPGFMYVAIPGIENDGLVIKVGFTRDPTRRAYDLRKPTGPGAMTMVAWWPGSEEDEHDFHAAHVSDRYPSRAGKRELYVPHPRFVAALIREMNQARKAKLLRYARGWDFDYVRGTLEGLMKTYLYRMGITAEDETE